MHGLMTNTDPVLVTYINTSFSGTTKQLLATVYMNKINSELMTKPCSDDSVVSYEAH